MVFIIITFYFTRKLPAPNSNNKKPLQEVANYVDQYRQFWEQRLDQLDGFLKELQTKENNP